MNITCQENIKTEWNKSNKINYGKNKFNFLFSIFFFCFQKKKIRTGSVSCKQNTMVYPVQLLMFAPCKVETSSGNNSIVIDGWYALNLFIVAFFH